MSKRKKEYLEMYKKYVLTIIIFLGIFLISFLCYHFYEESESKKITSSYLVKKKVVKEYKIEENLSDLKKLNGDYFIYISYTGSKEIYELEKGLKDLIKQYKLKDKFFYINIDSIKNQENKINVINEFLDLKEDRIEKVPTIIYVNKENEIKRSNIITRLDDNLIEKGDFQQLLDINDYKK